MHDAGSHDEFKEKAFTYFERVINYDLKNYGFRLQVVCTQTRRELLTHALGMEMWIVKCPFGRYLREKFNEEGH